MQGIDVKKEEKKNRTKQTKKKDKKINHTG